MNTHPHYTEEDYRDPEPVGICAVCGEPIYMGDDCFELPDGDLVHADGIFNDYRDRNTNQFLRVPCIGAYILEEYVFGELAAELGINKKRWP